MNTTHYFVRLPNGQSRAVTACPGLLKFVPREPGLYSCKCTPSLTPTVPLVPPGARECYHRTVEGVAVCTLKHNCIGITLTVRPVR